MLRLSKSKKIVPISQAAEILGVSIDTVRRWDKAGILHASRGENNVRYFSIEELEAKVFSKPLSISEAANRLGVSQTTLRRLEERKLINPERGHGGQRQYTKESLDEFLNSEYFLAQKHIEEKVLEPLRTIAVSEEPQVVIQQSELSVKDANAALQKFYYEQEKRISQLFVFRNSLYAAGIFLVTLFTFIIVVLTGAFLLFPEEAAVFLGYSEAPTYAKVNQSQTSLVKKNAGKKVLGLHFEPKKEKPPEKPSLFAVALKPFSKLSLNIVKILDEKKYAKIVPPKPIESVNDVFSVDEESRFVITHPIRISESSALQIEDKTLITNLNSDYIRGHIPGNEPGNIVIFGENNTIPGLTVTSSNISGEISGTILSDGTIVSEKLVDKTIAEVDLGDGVVTTIKVADSAITALKIADGTISNAEIADDAGIKDGKLAQITSSNKVAGSAIQLSETGGLVNNSGLSLLRSCITGQILSWDGSGWVCTAASSGAGDITGVTAGTGITGGGTSGDVTVSLDQAASPTWTGNHTFSGDVVLSDSGADTITIGNSTDTLSISSTGLNLTSAGAVSGVSTLSLSGDITWSAVTPNLAITNGETLTVTDGSNTLFSLVDNGTNGGLTVGGLTVSALNTAGGIIYANASGVFGVSAQGGAGQCLISGGSGAPSWSSCGENSNWSIASGALYPINSTVDLLVGGTSTSSAKFAIINVNSGTPTASVSGVAGAAFLTSTGAIQTTAMQSLTLGGGNTGNLVITAPVQVSGFGTGLVHVDSNGFLTSSAVSLTADVTGILPIVNGGSPFEQGSGAIIQRISTQDFLLGGTATASSKFAVINISGGVPTASLSAGTGNIALFSTGLGNIGTTNNQTLTIGGSSTGNLVLSPLNGSGLTTIQGAATITGTTVLSALSTGIAHIGSGGTITSSAVDLASNDITSVLGIANGGSPFEQGNGAIIERIVTQDLLLGSNATNSAKFGFLNVAGGTPTASISGAGNNSLFLTGAGTLGTTNAQTLSLGSGSTGDINFTINAGNALRINGTAGATQGSPVCVTTTNGIVTGSGSCPGGAVSNWDVANGAISAKFAQTLDLLIGGTSTGSAKFAVTNVAGGTPTASVSAGSGNNAAYLTGLGVLGTTNNQTLTIGNAATGNILLSPIGGVGSTTIQGTTFLSSLSTGIAHIGTGGVVTSSAVNLASADVTGVLPVVNGGSPFEQTASGAITQRLTTQDLLLGGISTTSAKFGFLNVAGGTPIASISGAGNNSLYLTGAGVLGTTNGQTLIIGSGTSDINFSLSGGSNLRINGTAGATVGTAACVTTTNGIVTGSGACPGGAVSPFETSGGVVTQTNTTQDLLIGGVATSSSKFAVINVAGGTPTASLSAGVTGGSFLTSAGTLQTTANQTLVLGGTTTGNIVLSPLNGSGRTTLQGSVVLSSLSTGILHADADGVLSSSAVNLASSDVTGILPVVNGGSPFEQSAGAIVERITTQDFLLGSTATSSAKFGFLNVAGGTPTASISAGINGGVFLTAGGSLQTTAKQSLTLGGGNTGNLVITAPVQVSGFGTGLLHADSNGFLSSSAVNLASADVTSILGVANGGSSFEVIASAITQRITTQDVLFGGVSTASAKFGFINIAGGTPVATISGNIALDSLGTIQTTKNQTLTFGGASTGNIFLAPIGGTGLTTIQGAATITGTTTLSSLSTGIAHIGSGGTITSSAVNLASGDVTGILGIVNGGSPFENSSGAIFGRIATQDFLLGSNATASARFGFLNVAGGTPTASISGSNNNSLFLTSAGVLGTTNSQTLSLGSTSTGDISVVINAGNNLRINGSTGATVGTAACVTTINGIVTGSGACPGGAVSPFETSGGVVTQTNTTQDLLIGGVATSSSKFAVLNVAGGTPTASLSAGITGGAFLTASGALQTSNKQSLTLGGGNTGNLVITAPVQVSGFGTGLVHVDSNGFLTSSAVSLTADVTGILPIVNGGSPFEQSNGAIFSRIANQDLLLGSSATASAKFGFLNVAGGTPTASISGTGNNALSFDGSGNIQTTNRQTLTLGGVATGDINLSFTGGSNLRINGAAGVTQGTPVCVTTANGIVTGTGSCPGGAVSPLETSGGVIVQANTTHDLLIGGVATSSSKFAVLNVAGGTPTASLSAGITGGAFLTASGALQTTAKQSLALGGGNTGNIVFSGFGAGIVKSNSTGVLSSSAVDLASTDITGVLPIANGGTNKNLTLSNGGIIWSDTDSFEVLSANANSGLALVSGGAGTPSWFAPTLGSVLIAGANGALSQDNANFFYDDSNNRLGIGTTAPTGALDVRGTSGVTPVSSISGKTSFATLLVDNTGAGDIFSASASGVARFTVTQNGSIITNGLTGSTVGTASCVTTTNGIVTGSGACPGGATSSWDVTGGAISPKFAATVDLLLGSNATAAARFGFLNVAGGTPTATLSAGVAGGAYLTAAGALQTTANQTLTLGGATTGNLVFNPINGTGNAIFNGKIDIRAGNGTTNAASVSARSVLAGLIVDNRQGDLFTASSSGVPQFVIRNGGQVGIGTSLPGANLDVVGSFRVSGASTFATGLTGIAKLASGVLSASSVDLTTEITGILPVANGGTNWNVTSGAIQPKHAATVDLLLGGVATNAAKIGFLNVAGGTPTASLSAGLGNSDGLFIRGTGIISTTNSQTLTLGGASNGNIVFSPLNGAGTVSVNGSLQMSSLAGTNAVVYASPTTGLFAAATTGSPGECLISGASTPSWGSCSAGGGSNWNVANGTIAPKLAATLDLLLGGTATNSSTTNFAKFGVLNIAGGTPTASVSAGTAGGASLNATGTLATTAKQTLTLGGASTGNIVIDAGSGLITLNDATTINGTVTIGTNNIVTGATTIASTELDRLDGKDAALVDQNDLTSSDGAGGTSTGSGLEAGTGGIGLLQGCSDGQVLKWTEATSVWGCAADTSGSGTSKFVVKGSNENVASGTTLQSDNDLTFAVGASETWVFDFVLRVTNINSATPDWKAAILGASGWTCSVTMTGLEPAAAVFPPVNGTDCDDAPTALANGTIVADANIPFQVNMRGTITTNSSGSVTLQWAANTSGSLTVMGGSYVIAQKVGGSDLAEVYYTKDDTIESGDVVSLDSSLHAGVKKASRAYDPQAIGIISTKPGLLLGDESSNYEGRAVMVALSGRVPAKVSSENGPIKPGDLLTSSSTPGVAMKATKAGQIIGQAMTSFDGGGIGEVLTFIKTDYSNGSGIVDLLSGVGQDELKDGALGKMLLTELINRREESYVDFSEIVTDRLAAGLEIITPHLVAQEVSLDTITVATGTDISLQLSQDGKFVIKDEVGQTAVSFDNKGNAFFGGTVTADKIRANQIEGLDLLISNIQFQISNTTKNATESAVLGTSDTPSALASTSATIGDILTLASLSVEGLARLDELAADQATISGTLRVKENGLIEGILTVIDTLTTNNLIVTSVATFFDKAIFYKDVEFKAHTYAGVDAAGETSIKKGNKKIEVIFEKEYEEEPIINVNLVIATIAESEFEKKVAEGVCSANESKQACQQAVEEQILSGNTEYVITRKSTKGFTILLKEVAIEELRFAWTAVGRNKE